MTSTHKFWQARYNKILLHVCETQGPHIYLALLSVRLVLPKLRSDTVLQREHGRSVGPISKEDKKLYFSEGALRKELRTMRAAEASMFADWLHHHLFCPAAKKRGEDVTPDLFEVSRTVSVSRQAPVPETWISRNERISFLQWVMLPLTGHWQGQQTAKQTLLGSILLAVVIMWLAGSGIEYLSNPDNYYGAWEAYRLMVLICILTVSGVWIWWGVGVMRFALKHLHRGAGITSTFLAFLAGLAFMLYSTASAVESGHEWALGLFNSLGAADVRLDTATNRIVFKGDVGYGSYRRMQRVIAENPGVRILELNSPGGYVIEGLAMTRLIKQSHLDTVTFRYCDSVCTLLFAAGKERYLGPRASIGFHRSSVFGKPMGDDWTDTEYRMAHYFEDRGVGRAFVKIAFSYRGDDLWLPKHGYMLDAGYATGKWQSP